MNIVLSLYGALRTTSININGQTQITIPEGTTVNSLIERIKIPREEIAVIIVNSTLASNETLLKENDIIELFPLCDGG